jgi:predicted TPR repeat methyltransferase
MSSRHGRSSERSRVSISRPTCFEKARRRGIYDRLIESDIAAFLDAQTDQFDLTVSTDVFIYIRISATSESLRACACDEKHKQTFWAG